MNFVRNRAEDRPFDSLVDKSRDLVVTGLADALV